MKLHPGGWHVTMDTHPHHSLFKTLLLFLTLGICWHTHVVYIALHPPQIPVCVLAPIVIYGWCQCGMLGSAGRPLAFLSQTPICLVQFPSETAIFYTHHLTYCQVARPTFLLCIICAVHSAESTHTNRSTLAASTTGMLTA